MRHTATGFALRGLPIDKKDDNYRETGIVIHS
jgi:hypothetical protein